VLCLALALGATANDPSGSWLSYASYTDPLDRRITLLNTTWVVPDTPKAKFGSNAPGWWFGIQTADGDGALIQPILAWGYQGNEYSIFNGVFDWTDGSWHTSSEVYTVKPGDLITSSVYYNGPEDNSYTMYIAAAGKSITTPYKIKKQQHKNESTAYFVLEHQPNNCRAYPPSGTCTFNNIYMEVDGKAVLPGWQTKQEVPKCNSKCVASDAQTITFTWDAKAEQPSTNATATAVGLEKWKEARSALHGPGA